MENEIQVSVCCIAYNQANYIRKTLEGFVAQETDFRFEVLIHDDASTDGTADIIREYAEKYPELIKPILQTENQYSKGVRINPTFNYPRAKGRYFAFCEGDDYWCDSRKLQKQYDAMENNPRCALCVHQSRCIDAEGRPLRRRFPAIGIGEGVLPAEQYIHLELAVSPWLFQTSSYFLKREVLDDWGEFESEYPVGDLPLVLMALQFGDCYFIAREMSCYRVDSGGAMSRIKRSNQAAILHYEKMIRGSAQFDQFTQFRYHEDFRQAIAFYQVQLYKLQGEFARILEPEYHEVWGRLNWKNHLLIRFGCCFPQLAFRIFDKMRKR